VQVGKDKNQIKFTHNSLQYIKVYHQVLYNYTKSNNDNKFLANKKLKGNFPMGNCVQKDSKSDDLAKKQLPWILIHAYMNIYKF